MKNCEMCQQPILEVGDIPYRSSGNIAAPITDKRSKFSMILPFVMVRLRKICATKILTFAAGLGILGTIGGLVWLIFPGIYNFGYWAGQKFHLKTEYVAYYGAHNQYEYVQDSAMVIPGTSLNPGWHTNGLSYIDHWLFGLLILIFPVLVYLLYKLTNAIGVWGLEKVSKIRKAKTH